MKKGRREGGAALANRSSGNGMLPLLPVNFPPNKLLPRSDPFLPRYKPCEMATSLFAFPSPGQV
jgi:hypothetical protein